MFILKYSNLIYSFFGILTDLTNIIKQYNLAIWNTFLRIDLTHSSCSIKF